LTGGRIDNAKEENPQMKLHAVLAASALAITSVSALAQSSPAGVPAERNTNQNVQPGPAPANPSDPSAGNDPAARIPTSPPGTGGASSGASSGESGLDSPAGSPADPSTTENQQPAPSTTNPGDPAAGADPAARIPTAPEKQQ
jgi:hypothetical protein